MGSPLFASLHLFSIFRKSISVVPYVDELFPGWAAKLHRNSLRLGGVATTLASRASHGKRHANIIILVWSNIKPVPDGKTSAPVRISARPGKE